MTKNVSLPVDVVEGQTYVWCRCGQSKTTPLCDGTHKQNANGEKPMRFTAENTTTVYLCSCGKTQNAPYCDGFTCDS